MHTRYLRTFVVAAEVASFSRAGAHLGLTQSAVSLQIRKLEDLLGCQLFERTGRSVRLTAEGRSRLPHIRGIVDSVQALQRGDPVGTAPPVVVTIGAISTVQVGLLPVALRCAGAALSSVRLNIVPGTSTELLSRVEDRSLGSALIVKPRLGLTDDMRWRSVMKERYVLVAPAGAPSELRALIKAVPFLRYARHSHGGQLVDRYLAQQRLWVEDILELDEPAALLQMVGQGLGCAILPGDLVHARTDGAEYRPLPGRAPVREIGLLTSRDAMKSPPIKVLLDAMRQAAGEIQGERRLRQA